MLPTQFGWDQLVQIGECSFVIPMIRTENKAQPGPHKSSLSIKDKACHPSTGQTMKWMLYSIHCSERDT